MKKQLEHTPSLLPPKKNKHKDPMDLGIQFNLYFQFDFSGASSWTASRDTLQPMISLMVLILPKFVSTLLSQSITQYSFVIARHNFMLALFHINLSFMSLLFCVKNVAFLFSTILA